MPAPRFVAPYFYWPNAAGVPLPKGALLFTLNGTDQAADTYSDPDLAHPNDNPVVADAAGTWPNIFLDPTVSYSVKLSDQNGAEVWTADDVVGAVEIIYAPTFEFLSGAPALASEVMGIHPFVATVAFSANFAGAAARIDPATLPTAPFTLTAKNNAGTIIGTLTFAVDGTYVFTTTDGAGVTIEKDDALTWRASAIVDATAANMAWTLSGVIVSG